jgi:hypothetical protein
MTRRPQGLIRTRGASVGADVARSPDRPSDGNPSRHFGCYVSGLSTLELSGRRGACYRDTVYDEGSEGCPSGDIVGRPRRALRGVGSAVAVREVLVRRRPPTVTLLASPLSVLLRLTAAQLSGAGGLSTGTRKWCSHPCAMECPAVVRNTMTEPASASARVNPSSGATLPSVGPISLSFSSPLGDAVGAVDHD